MPSPLVSSKTPPTKPNDLTTSPNPYGGKGTAANVSFGKSTAKGGRKPQKYKHSVGGHHLLLSIGDGRILKECARREEKFYLALQSALRERDSLLQNDHGRSAYLAGSPTTLLDPEGFLTASPIVNPPHLPVTTPVFTVGSLAATPQRSGSSSSLGREDDPRAPLPTELIPSALQPAQQQQQPPQGTQQHPKLSPLVLTEVTGSGSAELPFLTEEELIARALVCVSPFIPKFYGSQLLSETALESAVSTTEDDYSFNQPLQMLELQDVGAGFQHLCVLDLKMGTRQYGLNAPDRKVESKTRKARESTSEKLGCRASGWQKWVEAQQTTLKADKYECRAYSEDELFDAVRQFLNYDPALMQQFRRQVVELRKIFCLQNSFRFFTSSLLLVYDSARPLETARIYMVDFAYSYSIKEVRNAHDIAAFATRDDGYLVGLQTLARILTPSQGLFSSSLSVTGIGIETSVDGGTPDGNVPLQLQIGARETTTAVVEDNPEERDESTSAT